MPGTMISTYETSISNYISPADASNYPSINKTPIWEFLLEIESEIPQLKIDRDNSELIFLRRIDTLNGTQEKERAYTLVETPDKDTPKANRYEIRGKIRRDNRDGELEIILKNIPEREQSSNPIFRQIPGRSMERKGITARITIKGYIDPREVFHKIEHTLNEKYHVPTEFEKQLKEIKID